MVKGKTFILKIAQCKPSHKLNEKNGKGEGEGDIIH